MAFIGLVLAAAGVFGIVMVGSDETVHSPETAIDARGAAVVSTPGIVAFRDLTLVVTARSSSGSVFLGSGHPIDVASYLGGAPRVNITGVTTSGLTTQQIPGRGSKTPTDPAKASFWDSKATGSVTPSLVRALDGSPAQYVVMGAGTLTVSQGVRLPGVWPLVLVAAVVGVVLLGLGVWLMRRRPRVVGEGASRPGPCSAGPAPAEPTTSVTDDPRTVARSGVSPVARALAVGLVATSLSGCAAIPQAVAPWTEGSLRKPALAADGGVPLLADYDTRNNAVLASTKKPRNGATWKAVDDESILAYDLYSTRLDAVDGKETPAQSLTHGLKALYVPEFSGYPMYVMVAASVTVSPATPTPDPKYVALMVLRRDSATAPWKHSTRAAVATTALPAARAPGAASTPSPADRRKVLAAATSLQAHIGSGKPMTVVPDARLKEILASFDKNTIAIATRSMSAEFFAAVDDQTAPGGSIRTVLTDAGVLASVSYVVGRTYVAKDSYTLRWQGLEGQVRGQTGDRGVLSERDALTVLLLVGTDGRVRCLGASLDPIL